ncbi:MAG: ABC transporter permease [Alphaproteobacteria bacterium]
MPPSSEPRTSFARLAGLFGRSNEVALLACLVAVIVFFGFASEYFFSLRNMSNVLGQASIMLIAGIGVAMVFMSGEVDISVGSLMAAVAIPLIEVMNATGSLALGIGAALLLGLVIGTVNGLLAAYAGINSLIVTLGTLFIVRGGVYLYTGKQAIPDKVYLESFFQIGNETLLGILPYSALIAFALVAVFAYVMGWRRFGRQVYAVGSSAAVARLAGFDTRRVKFICFVLSSLLATLAGVLLASRVGSAVHVAGLNFEFQVVAAVVLGGVSLAGGIGTIAGMALGVLILAFVANGLGMLDFPTEWQLVITGAVIVAAVAIDEAKRRRAALTA